MSAETNQSVPAVPANGVPATAKPRTVPTIHMGSRGIMLATFEDLQRFGKMMLDSGFCPKGSTLAGVCITIQMGLELGITPTQAVQGIAAINGRPSVFGDLGTALVRGSGLLVKVEEGYDGQWGTDDYTAYCRLWRAGEANPIEGFFSIADAKRAKLWGKTGPWTDFPRRMLLWRARSFAYRDGFADVLRGLMFREEVDDLPPRSVAVEEILPVDDQPQAVAAEVEAPESAPRAVKQRELIDEIAPEPVDEPGSRG